MRCRYVRFSGAILVNLLTAGKHPAGQYQVVADAVPSGAKVISVRWGWGPQTIELLIEHDSFAPVPEGTEIPMLCPVFKAELEPGKMFAGAMGE